MRLNSAYLFVLFLSFSGKVLAEDGWSQLGSIADQANVLSFSGQYVRQTDHSPMQSFTVYRLYKHDSATTRQVAMNGNAHELIKTPSKIQFYASNKLGLLQAKMDSIRIIPALLPTSMNILKNNYLLVHKNNDRVAACQCKWWWLVPKNKDLYTQGFCLEQHTGLPLVHIYKTDQDITEQNSFTHLSFDAPSAKDMQADNTLTKQESMLLNTPPSSWNTKKINDDVIKSLPSGFFILTEHRVKMPNARMGRHYMITDGLVKISLFIEKATQPSSTETIDVKKVSGALSMGSKVVKNIHIVAVGDLPIAGLKDFLANKIVINDQYINS